MIDVNDFVILVKQIEDIEVNSVGLVKDMRDDLAVVFFIGKKKEALVEKDNIEFIDLTKTGKPYDAKICNICHVLKKNSEFDINQTDAIGRKTTRPSCKLCRIQIDGVRMPSTEKAKLEKIKPKLLFTCPICTKMSIVGVTANLVKDHDHTTGRAREWICDSCNTGLGRFRDNIDLLRKLIEYLEKHSSTTPITQTSIDFEN